MAYSLAGADCIDMAADLAVVKAAKEGLAAARKVAEKDTASFRYREPLLMVSMSAGEDPHFRKAWFDAQLCPQECDRPCENICPAAAINDTGVVSDRCYGCGRCLPICPYGLIEERARPTTLDAIAQTVLTQVDALEIHTQVGHVAAFKHLWQTISPWTKNLKLISVSCPDDESLADYLNAIQTITGLGRSNSSASPKLIWQTDGRPMSGDIGKGTTHAAIKLAQKVLKADLPGYVQLAGGTNQYTVSKLKELGLLGSKSRIKKSFQHVSGVAYGSYARRLLMPVIEQTFYLEEDTDALQTAVALAESLVNPLKQAAMTS